MIFGFIEVIYYGVELFLTMRSQSALTFIVNFLDVP